MPGAERVLVFGASGFFGSWICRKLEEAGFEAVPARARNGDRADLLEIAAGCESLPPVTPAAVVNAAGMTSPARAAKDPAGCFEINTRGTVNLLEALRRQAPGARMVALSSAAVYSGEPPFRESSPTGAENAYAASKLAMELYCGHYAKWAGLPISVLRCFNLTGPGEPPSQATSEFVLAALGAGGDVATVEVGDPEIARDLTDVRDAARAVAAVLEAGAGGTYNLCSGVSTSLARLAGTIGGLTGVSLRLRAAESRAASGLDTIRGDNSLLHEATGWRPAISLEQSLTDLVESRR